MLSAVIRLVVRGDGRVYYTARDGICLVFGRSGVSLTHPVLKSLSSYVGWGVYLTFPLLASVSSLDFSALSIARPVLQSVLSKSKWAVCLTRHVL